MITHQSSECPEVFRRLWWIDLDVLVLSVIKYVFVFGELPRKDKLAVQRDPVVLLPSVMAPEWLIGMDSNGARVVGDDVWICADDIRERMVTDTVLVDPQESIQSCKTFVDSSKKVPDQWGLGEAGVAAVVVRVESHHSRRPPRNCRSSPRDPRCRPRRRTREHWHVHGYEDAKNNKISDHHTRSVSRVLALLSEEDINSLQPSAFIAN